ncbi:MAG TPA: metal ABC transporter permease [Dehalococcoidia bacterium]|nr:metal ABC transporter permease [Dehalococcoidia bacterium]
MSTLTDPLSDPAFVRALFDVVAVAIVAGVIGTFIVLRGIGFLGDALAHSIFPGVVIAFLMGANLLVGALVAGMAAAALMGLLTANARVRDNTSIGVIFTAAFALGVVVLSNRSIGVDQLEGILFGDPLAAKAADVAMTLTIGCAVLAAMIGLRRLFVMASFDPSGARAMGLPVVALDVLLLALTALTVVVAFKAVGDILVISLMITPAATARLFTDRLLPTALVAAGLGSAASIAGLYLGYHQSVSPGGTIVLIATSVFFSAWLAAPRHGLVAGLLARRDRSLLRSEPEAVAEVILASPEIRDPHER